LNLLYDSLFLSGKPINISFSGLNTWERCPRRKLLELAVPKNEWAKLQEQRNFVAGSVVHDLFAEWVLSGFADDFMTEDRVRIAFDEYVAKLRRKGLPVTWRDSVSVSVAKKWGVYTDYEYNLKKATQAATTMVLIARSLQLPLRRVLSEEWVRVEHPADDRFRFIGAVDIYDFENDIIYDIKVTENTRYGNPLQLAFYGMLLGSQLGRLPGKAAFIYPLGANKIVAVDFKEYFGGLKEQVDKFIVAFDEMRFPPKPSRDCATCPVRTWCSAKGGYFKYEEYLNE